MSVTYQQKNLGTYKNLNLDSIACGAVAIADIVYNKNIGVSPLIVSKYLVDKGYLTKNGTSRIGITEALKNYGFNSLYFADEYRNGKAFETFFKILKESSECEVYAIALMGNCGNSYWTRGGHYIAITSYMKDPKTGSEFYYVRDGANGRTGWHKLEDFKGCFVSGWIITKLY